MARKTERVNDNDNQDRHKKVKFDEDRHKKVKFDKNATVYLYDKEIQKRKETN